MKKFLRCLLFLTVSVGLMLAFGERLQQWIVPYFPDPSHASYGTSGRYGDSPAPDSDGDAVQSLLPDSSRAYYYSQLSENAKALYSAVFYQCLPESGEADIRITLPQPVTVIKEEGESEDDFAARLARQILETFQPALDALAYDHPEIDWIRMGEEDGSAFSYTTTHLPFSSDTATVTKLSFRLKCEERDGGIAAYCDRLLETAASTSIPDGLSRYDTLLLLQQALCERVSYCTDAPYAHEAAGALLYGQAVCDGYAKAFKLLCDENDIPCIVVPGKAFQYGSEEPHAWNYVQMENGLWYAIDTTWNDREGSTADTRFFLVGKDTVTSYALGSFSQSHLPSGSFSPVAYEPFRLPALSSERYLPESIPSEAA